MGTVTVTPTEFNLVDFDPERISAIAEKLVGDVGLADVDVQIEVDETSPLGRSKLTSEEPVSIWAESGAFEGPKRPRQLSEAATADVVGRLRRDLDGRQPDLGGSRRARRPSQGGSSRDSCQLSRLV